MVLQLKQLFITSCVGDFDGAYKLDSTLQNSSEDQLLTVLLHGFEKFALNVNKKIIRLIVSYLKVSGRFVQSFFWPTTFVFIFFFLFFFFLSIHLLSLYVLLCTAYCKWLYLTWVLCLVSSTVLCIIFHIYCFIVNFYS